MSIPIDEITGLPAAPGGTDFEQKLEEILAADHNGEMQQEFDTIAMMIDRADQYGLLVEVVRSYGSFRAGGDSVRDAAHAALYEWDV